VLRKASGRTTRDRHSMRQSARASSGWNARTSPGRPDRMMHLRLPHEVAGEASPAALVPGGRGRSGTESRLLRARVAEHNGLARVKGTDPGRSGPADMGRIIHTLPVKPAGLADGLGGGSPPASSRIHPGRLGPRARLQVRALGCSTDAPVRVKNCTCSTRSQDTLPQQAAKGNPRTARSRGSGEASGFSSTPGS
jgi:hypothetical protein